ncbi:HK97 family phage prohead protease [Corynebacterium lipophiloflavum]|uniref:Phage prohead protease, HK97 family n=1 Tax=Corynebacterium lipophiloflavum (strain ATCC 700352 / DSM 44291 / CCUG 37336 / JCM 10383 / DMMZ 1944) TaxID=525263 RepID=C0XU07_CORLD|nr:HK97 family phage prohead protease [Corynebacterium lipophiloflavum]EEI16269.1 phage prohead protease, HK97 family [Corynebacterium lipophiloflavum DSM 44291]
MIHVVMGPPCSGKSTFVDANAAPGVARFDLEKIASTVAAQPVVETAPGPVMDAVLAMRRGLTGWLLDAEAPVEEFWLVNSRPPDTIITALAALGATFHVLDPGENECIARAMREGRPDATIERIKQWYLNPPEIPGEKGEKVTKTKTKTITVGLKAAPNDTAADGTFEGYASVFNNEDTYGDLIRPGAFAETIADFQERGRVVPVLYGHDFADPFSNIGAVEEIREDDHGLRVTARLDLDNPKAAQVYRLMKAKRLNEMSFAFNVLDGGFAEVDGHEVYEITRVKLYEVSVVPVGANPQAEILTVKQATEALVTAAKQANPAVAESVAMHAGSIAELLDPGRDFVPGTGGTVLQEITHEKDGELAAYEAHLQFLERKHYA